MWQINPKQQAPAFHRSQRVFARATEIVSLRGLSAALGGFLLLLFFVRQRKVKGKNRAIWYNISRNPMAY
jgi:hypothetical protein